jgi:hypothetical protein
MTAIQNSGISALVSDKLNLPADTPALLSSFQSAQPFPHIVFDDFFDIRLLDQVARETPEVDGKNWVCESDDRIQQFNLRSPVTLAEGGTELVSFLHSAAFLYFLSEITGIWNLLPDPYLQGGGYHLVPRGGFFHIHADRNVAYETGLNRRLALIIYLNKDWKHEYGGQLELWNADATRCEKVIEPIFNRCVIFEVADTYFHGLPATVDCPKGRSRNSFNVYYHTVAPSGKAETTPHSSIYAPSFYRPSRFSARGLAKDLTPPIVLRTLKKLLL